MCLIIFIGQIESSIKFILISDESRYDLFHENKNKILTYKNRLFSRNLFYFETKNVNSFNI